MVCVTVMGWLRRALGLGTTVFALGGVAQPAAADVLWLMRNMSPYDHDGDGIAEINRLRPAGSLNATADFNPTTRPYVLIFVEPRLMNDFVPATYRPRDLYASLQRLRGDLSAEGLDSILIEADVYRGERHQDGLTLLALRSFVKQTRQAYPRLDGVILIGHFPDPTIVQRILWRRRLPMSIKGTPVGDRDILVMDPEVIASRSDIVLADLDGNWDARYVQARTQVENVFVAPRPDWGEDWPQSRTYTSALWEVNPPGRERAYQDYFLLDDAWQQRSDDGQTLTLTVSLDFRNPEVSARERGLATPLSMPEIYVSRIDPYGSSYVPDPSFRDDTGQGLYDADGRPRILNTSVGPRDVHDPNLERTLLMEHLANNHLFRTGVWANHLRCGVATGSSDFSAWGYSQDLMGARTDWSQGPYNVQTGSLPAYAAWLREHVTLRGVQSHSNEFGSEFVFTSPEDLEAAVGPAHHWQYQGENRWAPFWYRGRRWADFPFFYALWRNGTLPRETTPSFTIHGGCDVNKPMDWHHTVPYNRYEPGQNAEAQLFLTKSLGVMARAKVYYDNPIGWQDDFRVNASLRFGDIWKRFYEHWSTTPFATKDRSAVKSPYWWSLLGDYTLRLRYLGGLGILGTHASGAETSQTLIEGGSIEGWTYNSASAEVMAVGNFAPASGAEFFMRDAAGTLVLAGFDGMRYRLHMQKPAGSRFDEWTFDAGSRVDGAGQIDGVGGDDVIVRNLYGMGLLTYDDAAKTLRSTGVRSWGTTWGSGAAAWMLSQTDVFRLADLDGDGRQEIVVTNPRGIGVLAFRSGVALTIMNCPNHTWFGGWNFASHQNTIAGFANFDADPAQEMVIQSDWGMAILDYIPAMATFTSPFIKPDDTQIGNWRFRAADRVIALGNFVGDARADILIRGAGGLGVWETTALGPSGVLVVPNGTPWTGATSGVTWNASASDELVATGDFDADGKDEIVLRGMQRWLYTRLYGSTLEPARIHIAGLTQRGWSLAPSDFVAGVADMDPLKPGKEMLVRRAAR